MTVEVKIETIQPQDKDEMNNTITEYLGVDSLEDLPRKKGSAQIPGANGEIIVLAYYIYNNGERTAIKMFYATSGEFDKASFLVGLMPCHFSVDSPYTYLTAKEIYSMLRTVHGLL